jgi:trk system potassium uptake protein TrkA
MIVGGGTIAYYLGRQLSEAKISLKIIEQDEARCKELSELLPNAIIIRGDAADRQLLLEEGIERTDAFVTLTGFDEENIILSLYAKQLNSAKCITKINKISFNDVIEELDVGSVVCPKYITAEYIIQHVRFMQNTKGSNVEALYRMEDNRVEALEFSIREPSKATDVSLMRLQLKKGLIIAGIIRNSHLLVPSGKDMIQVGDTVIIVTTNKGLKDITDILD